MIDGKTLRDAIISGANNIMVHRSEVDELNVFPVPDGDTGTNMSMTTDAARSELALLPNSCTAEEVANLAASAMLRGARGNSGVITSLLFRGFSKGFAGKKQISAKDFTNALQQGVQGAYKAVMKPTEGTMLTVARVSSEKASLAAETDVKKLINLIVEEADKALIETPNQLEVLKKAGVVDAGGKGFCYILKGMQSVIVNGKIIKNGNAKTANKAKPKPATHNVGKGVFSNELNPDITNAYCTEFLINKENGANVINLRAFLESNGDSVVIVEDNDIIKCHIHTADPGKVLSKAVSHGYLTKIKIENMHEQYEGRKAQGTSLEKQAQDENQQDSEFHYAAINPERAIGFVAVAAGEGIRNVFKDLGVDAVVSGGQTMNPSTEDILAAVQSVAAQTVFVLPNNKNIIMAAEQAAKVADRKVVVLPTRTLPQGMSAMLAFNSEHSVKNNIIEMNKIASKVSTGLITFAARNSEFDGRKIRRGEILALENGKLSAVGNDVAKMTYRLARNMCKRTTSFVTIISGCDVDEEDAQKTLELVRDKISASVEVTLINGGQPVYYYMLSVE